MKNFDKSETDVVLDLRDRTFQAALNARRKGFTQTALALDKILEELMRRPAGSSLRTTRALSPPK